MRKLYGSATTAPWDAQVARAARSHGRLDLSDQPDGVAAVAALLAEEDAPAGAGARSPGLLAGS